MRNKIIVIAFLASLLAGCNLGSSLSQPTATPTPMPTLEFVQPTAIQPVTTTPPVTVVPAATSTPLSTEEAVLKRAAGVVSALKNKDLATLATYVDPQMGLRFSPYAAVKETDLVFPAATVAGLMADTTVFTWGAYQATGEPIDLTFADYYAKFIYDEDFASAPQVSLNRRLGVSTTLDNSQEFYSNAMVVEYYFPGFDPSLEGMDWRSLRLVFVQDQDTWYLVGIIHDQWTT